MSDEFNVDEFEAPPPDLSEKTAQLLYNKATEWLKKYLKDSEMDIFDDPGVQHYLQRKGLQQDMDDRIFDCISPYLNQLVLTALQEALQPELQKATREIGYIE